MPTDTERLDWLEKQLATQHLPTTFWFALSGGEIVMALNMMKPWKVRAAIDASMGAESDE